MRIACRYGHIEIVRLLLDCGVSADHGYSSPLETACEFGHTRTAELLLDRGARPQGLIPRITTPLLVASKGGYDHIVRLLLERGVPAELRGPDMYYGPLDAAVSHCGSESSNHVEAARLLLAHGASVEGVHPASPGLCCSPLCCAIQRGNVRMVRLLLKQGACLERKVIVTEANEHGYFLIKHSTPLDEARKPLYRKPAIISLLDKYLLAHYTIRVRLCVVGRRTSRRSGHPSSARHMLASEPYLSRSIAAFLVGELESLALCGSY